MHEGVRFPCTVCAKSFNFKSNLSKHLKNMHNMYICFIYYIIFFIFLKYKIIFIFSKASSTIRLSPDLYMFSLLRRLLFNPLNSRERVLSTSRHILFNIPRRISSSRPKYLCPISLLEAQMWYPLIQIRAMTNFVWP